MNKPKALLREIRAEKAAQWDRQIESDIQSGRLNDLAEEARAAHRRGESREL